MAAGRSSGSAFGVQRDRKNLTMDGRIALAGTVGGIALGVALILWLGPPLAPSREEAERKPQNESAEAAVAHLNEVMNHANRSLEISQVVRGGPELVGGERPFAIYTVTLLKGIPEETYFFERQEYTKDLGSEVETYKLCETVASSAPKDLQHDESWSGSRTIDETQFSFGPIQFPLRALASDVARLFGYVAREPETSFKRLEILVHGFADGTVGNWELDLLGAPYDFHSIPILRQLDSKSDKTPARFTSTASAFLIGQRYRNEHLGNLRAAFVAQDIITPMLEGCLKDKQVEVKILEGYVSNRPHNPLQRKVEVHLNFY